MPGYDAYYFTPADRGYLGESTYVDANSGGSTLPTAGRLEGIRLKVPQAGWCTNINLGLSTAASAGTPGQNFAALYTAGGVLIAQSVDQTTNWGATGLKAAQLNGGPYFLHAGEYYVGFWFNGATGPTLRRPSSVESSVANAGLAAPNLRCFVANTGLTTAAPATMGTQSAAGAFWWAGLS